jgi:hypothetical protein
MSEKDFSPIDSARQSCSISLARASHATQKAAFL